MARLRLGRYSTSSYVAAALLAACSGSQPPIGVPGALPQSRAIVTHAQRGGSWMLREAKNSDLLYVADAGENHNAGVDIFLYPSLKRVGMIADGNRAFGECVDTNGNVYVVESRVVVEYAHASSTPVKTLGGPASQEQYNWSCSIDPTTGNLAVTANGYEGGAYVFVYPQASGPPVEYETIEPVYNVTDVAYDSHGDLFVLGLGLGSIPRPAYVLKLRFGGMAFVPVRLRKEHYVSWIGGLVWNAGSIVLGSTGPDDLRYKLRGKNDRRATETGQIPLPGAGNDHTGFFIQGNRLIQPSTDADSVFIYTYPAGTLVKTIKHFGEPLAAVISEAPK
jgi:hypothetical protein